MSGDWNDDIDEFEAELAEMQDDCDHEHYDTDILTGRAFCANCCFSWYQTADEIQRESKRQEEYDRMCEEWDREEAERAAPTSPDPT